MPNAVRLDVASEQRHHYQGLVLAERYTLDELLTQGALCVVYRGQDMLLRRTIAIKAVPPASVAAYRAALHATATLTHPAILATYDAIDHDGWLFLIQEYLPGRALGSYFGRGVPVERAIDLAGQIARALAYAHVHGVTHGDLTPAAVLVDRRASVRVGNFGLPPDSAYFAASERILLPDAPKTPVDEALPSDDLVQRDVRAVGYLLWQMLVTPAIPAAPAPSAAGSDARVAVPRTFRAEVPSMVRSLVERTLVRGHPQQITTADALATLLEDIGHELAHERTVVPEATPPALAVARAEVERVAPWSLQATQGTMAALYNDPTIPGASTDNYGAGGYNPNAYSAPTDPASHGGAVWINGLTPVVAAAPRLRLPSRPVDLHGGHDVGLRDDPRWQNAPYWASADAPHATQPPSTPSRAGESVNLTVVILVGLALFALFFVVGYLSPPLLWQH